jgi:hypothetical protein
MKKSHLKTFLFALPLMAAFLFFILPALTLKNPGQAPSVANAQQACTSFTDPAVIPAPSLINFDDLPDAALIAEHYRPTFGVTFEDGQQVRAITYGIEPDKAHSIPNVAINDAVPPGNNEGIPMRINFDEPKTHVGFYVGNGETAQITALLTAYDSSGAMICEMRLPNVPEPHTAFMGLYDPDGRIVSVTLDYGKVLLSESIDDLYFAPRRGIPPRRTPMPTWTPVPTSTPLPGPSPTPTSVVPMYAYHPALIPIAPILFNEDLSIHGIEITQGIQCFDPSKGLATCANNSMPVVDQKDTSARIYLKYSSSYGVSQNNVPVRLFIRAAGVWYQADASGKATTSMDQTNPDSANIYFNVNFTSDVTVDFYAIVDPNNNISETDETNNRYPAIGYVTLTFRPRNNLKIVGQRLYYHPSGYSGQQFAGGWAVNGGAADWFEQILPMRNSGINYSVKSGYLNWTTSLGSGDGQHSLISTLNAQWIIENAFSFWFSGAFTGTDHVYGWAPNDGYSGGHADMPIYPHAGGFGVVGIGSDRPGTSTDAPGGGALIFGHELVHDYNVYHTDTADACGSNDNNSDFPYGTSSIQEVGFNPFTAKIYSPANTHDLMSYCPSGGSKLGWIAPFTWNKLFNDFALSTYSTQTDVNSQPYIMHPTLAGESLVINATVYNPDLNPQVPGTLGELYRTEAGVAYTLPPGDYAVELRNVDGAVLASYPFVVSFLSEYSPDPGAHAGLPIGTEDAPPFPADPTSKIDVSFIVPWMDGTHSVALVHQGNLLDQRVVSNNPPQVLITSPTAAETWNQGETHTISWQGLDLDGDPLLYNLFYSNNGGSDWILLQGDLTAPTYQVSVNSMAGGSDVRFRVVASDGINTAIDETDQAISIPNQPPVPTILTPTLGFTTVPGGLVVLHGSATDMEDGSLPDSGLVWSSDRQGELGIGPTVALISLKPGTHIITLTATDSYGISRQAQVQIKIVYPLYVPRVGRN